MISLTELKSIVQDTEREILAGNTSNNVTLKLFMYIGMYKSLGGKEDLIWKFRTNGMIKRLPTEKAKENYVSIAINYSIACEIYFTLMRHSEKYIHGKRECYFAHDLVEHLNFKCKDMLEKYHIKLSTQSSDLIAVIAGGRYRSEYRVRNAKEIEKMCKTILQYATSASFEGYIGEILGTCVGLVYK